ncbi:L-type lectin-domain containing receptor kinase IV.1-like [Olea europaea var. sylvestris]|uniref:L-type lectin-domain containing receptor kinase IV.1-like n=1 Tax=Olea europaea var. sylvestris TaxID=158386 RepID=UPI000C1CE985|nr:L-type lectin-domain containing receptor kinase IV.1-like [Olea europaea var. sylvestris]
MFFKIALLALYFLVGQVTMEDVGFKFNGFRSANLSLNGIAGITSSGLLQLTNATRQEVGQAFYPSPINFKNSNGSAFSFSTSFVFAIEPEYPDLSGHGIAFVLAPTRIIPGARGSQFFGLFNETNNDNSSNHVFAVELDTIQNNEFRDINFNHVGIDINGMTSNISKPAGYYANGNGVLHNLTLYSGKPMQVWVEYDGLAKKISVTLAPLDVNKPNTSLLSLLYDLSPILKQTMYVGFSSSTGSGLTSHYVLGWSFKVNGISQGLDLSRLPKVPRIGPKEKSKFLTIGLPTISLVLLLTAISGMAYYMRRKKKYAEEIEDWELEYGPHRFKYRDLYVATKGFREKELLGTGGFGRVFRGVLPTSKVQVAVKRVSHESRQGMREFVAEIASLGRLRHRNLVPLLGYCRRKAELLLVYEYMPNGSLDKFIYDQPKFPLNWDQRFRVIKGVASGLLYLHEEWEQVVVHRDVKASNVLVDGELNGRLGDFGLARLYDHGTDPQTTHVVGTLGYLAPEHSRCGRATPSTDVYAFGAFLLEVACGRRPIDNRAPTEDIILVDWVFSHWNSGEILQAVDPKLGNEYVKEEVELVLKLGLICSHSDADARPNMRQILLCLESAVALPELSSLRISGAGITFAHGEGFDEFIMSKPSSASNAFSYDSSVADSLLSGGR